MRVVVAGGGAAGMMAALAAAEGGAAVTLLEQNEKLGKKVYITGKGRCNLTNDCRVEDFFGQVVNNAKFLYSSVYGFTPQDAMRFFTAQGCPVKTERGGRVFPVSDHASDVIRALERALRAAGVEIRLHTRVRGLATDMTTAEVPRVRGVCLDGGDVLSADAVILAGGGKSYAATGADGSLLDLAQTLGHRIIPTQPALVPLLVKEEACAALQGLSLKNVAAMLYIGKKRIYEGFGEMLFTHYGVSGPMMLSASSLYSRRYAGQAARLVIDLKPALKPEQLDARLLRDFDANKNKQLASLLHGLLPATLAEVMPELCGIPAKKRVHEITKEERRILRDMLKALPFTVTGTRDFTEAIITSGGVSTKEIAPSTLASKRVSGLYFAGEMIDVDAFTGGYNLQIAWATGRRAGMSAAEALR